MKHHCCGKKRPAKSHETSRTGTQKTKLVCKVFYFTSFVKFLIWHRVIMCDCNKVYECYKSLS